MNKLIAAAALLSLPALAHADELHLGGYTIDYDAADLSQVDGHYVLDGDIDLPVAGGFTMTLAGAVLTLRSTGGNTYALEEGYVEALETNFTGANALGQLTGRFQGFSVGYALGSALGYLEAPLTANTHYLFLYLDTNVHGSWGGMDLEAGPGKALTFALDATDPAIYVRAAGLWPDMAGSPVQLGEVAVGFSAHNNFSWNATTTWGPAGPYLTTQHGGVYVGGEVTISEPGVPVGISLSGDILLDMDYAALANGAGAGAIEGLASNTDVDLTLNLEVASISIDLGQASTVWRKGDYFAISGEFDPADVNLGNLSRMLDGLGSGRASIVVDGKKIDAKFDADINLGDGFNLGNGLLTFAQNEVIVSGRRTTVSTATMQGSVNFGGTHIQCTGSADSQGNFSVSGEAGFSAKFSGVKFKGDITATITQNGFSGKAKAQACVAGHCDSVNATVDIKDNGKIQVCARLPQVGKKCDTI